MRSSLVHFAIAVGTLLPATGALANEPPLTVDVEPATALDAAALRRAILADLGQEPPPGRDVSVEALGPRRVRIVVRPEGPVRDVDLVGERARDEEMLAILIAELLRDEAAELLRQLGPQLAEMSPEAQQVAPPPDEPHVPATPPAPSPRPASIAAQVVPARAVARPIRFDVGAAAGIVWIETTGLPQVELAARWRHGPFRIGAAADLLAAPLVIRHHWGENEHQRWSATATFGATGRTGPLSLEIEVRAGILHHDLTGDVAPRSGFLATGAVGVGAHLSPLPWLSAGVQLLGSGTLGKMMADHDVRLDPYAAAVLFAARIGV